MRTLGAPSGGLGDFGHHSFESAYFFCDLPFEFLGLFRVGRGRNKRASKSQRQHCRNLVQNGDFDEFHGLMSGGCFL